MKQLSHYNRIHSQKNIQWAENKSLTIKNIAGHAVLYWLLMIALFAPRVLHDATFNALSCLRLSFSKLPEFFQYTRSKFDRNYVRRSHFSPVQPCSHPDVH